MVELLPFEVYSYTLIKSIGKSLDTKFLVPHQTILDTYHDKNSKNWDTKKYP